MILYNDTEKELFYNTDYKPLPKLSGLSFQSLYELLDNLYSAADNASINGATLLENALYDDIVELKKYILTNTIKSYSSSTIAGIIGNTKYNQIDIAVNKTLLYLYNTEPENIIDIYTDPQGIADIIIHCYKDKTL